MGGGKPNSVSFKLKQGFEQLSQRIITDPVADLDPDLKEEIVNSLWNLLLFRALLYYWHFIRPQLNENQTEDGADMEPIVSDSEFPTEEGADMEPIVSDFEIPAEEEADMEPIASDFEIPAEEEADNEPNGFDWENPTQVKNDEHNLDLTDPVECFLKEIAMPDLKKFLIHHDFDVSEILSLKEEQMEKLGIPKARIPELLGKIKEYQSF